MKIDDGKPVEVIDLKKQFPEHYSTRKKMLAFEMPKATYLSIPGTGAPGGQAYIEAIGALYGVVYTSKFTLKAKGITDFKILPLECRWGEFDHETTPHEQWQWTLQIRVPDSYKPEWVDMARGIIKQRKGEEILAPEVVQQAGYSCLQLLHLGPYEEFQRTYDLLEQAAAEAGDAIDRTLCREIYLSDPRRTKPERLKTIIRVGVD
jgi:hypothetical protein